MNGHRHDNGGFTLIEMLVAISIVMLVVPLAIQGVRTGLGAWERVARQADSNDRRRSAQRVIRNQLESALPLQGLASIMDRHVVFKGEPHAIEFASRLPRGARGGGVYINRLEVVSHNGTQQLTLSYWPFARGQEAARMRREARSVVLVRDLESLSLRYFGRTTAVNRAAWHYDWKRQFDLPERVELDIAYRQGTGSRRLSLQIPLHTSAKEAG
jgi:general secretion pathway protein J